ncbi:hypothetical protein HN011_006398 [Eciton burchellii]|nr:hypothetical protein HN011_006398 [Eciton burchellii]
MIIQGKIPNIQLYMDMLGILLTDTARIQLIRQYGVSLLIFFSTLANQLKRGRQTKTTNIHKWKPIQRQKNQGLDLLHRPKIIAPPIKCPKISTLWMT